MSRQRLLATAAAAVCIALVGPAASTAAAPPDIRQLTLHLPDLPPGYVIDRSGPSGPCSYLTFIDEVRRDVLRILKQAHADACTIVLDRIWAAPETPSAPSTLASIAARVGDPGAAAALLARPRAFASAFIPLRRARWVERPTATLIGDATRVLRTGAGPLAEGPGVAVLWRSESVVAMVFVMGQDPAPSQQMALQLAALQQTHVAAPAPLLHNDFDDAEVALEDPAITVPIYWLGRKFDGGPRLPTVRLLPGDEVDPVDRSEGLESTLSYGRGNRVAFQIDLLRPHVLTGRDARSELRRLRHDDCIRTEQLAVTGGHATLFAGRPHCRTDLIVDGAVALVQLPDVAMRVGCVDCFPARTRYTSLAGLRAVVRTLHRRS